MLLALTDHLRCTAEHADTWLVARADVAEHGWMVEGVLGCPVCHAERVVHDGVVVWDAVAAGARAAGGGAPLPGDAAALRLAALLALADSPAPYVVCGAAGVHAPALGGIAGAPLVLLDPPDDSAAGLATVIRGAPHAPFAARSMRGIALDAWHAGPGRIEFAVRALAPGGRMVADASVTVPAGIRELARDAAQWVGERASDEATPVPIAIGRAPRGGGR